MGALPQQVEHVLDRALVAELTVVNPAGRLVTYPLIPLFDGRYVYFTSSVLFSKKLEHIKNDPRVSVSVTDPVATPDTEPFTRVTIQGDAQVLEEDMHEGWMGEVYELWKAKEPVIEKFVRMRFAFPLFFERSVIRVTPRRVLLWPAVDEASGEAPGAPQVTELDPEEVSSRG